MKFLVVDLYQFTMMSLDSGLLNDYKIVKLFSRERSQNILCRRSGFGLGDHPQPFFIMLHIIGFKSLFNVVAFGETAGVKLYQIHSIGMLTLTFLTHKQKYQNVIIMGNCVREQTVINPKLSYTVSYKNATPHIEDIDGQLLPHHSQLNNTLKSMFDKQDRLPGELVLNFMLYTDRVKQENGIFSFQIQSKTELKVWAIHSCYQIADKITNITLKITEYVRANWFTYEAVGSKQIFKYEHKSTPKRQNEIYLLIIIEEPNQLKQSRFMYYYFREQSSQIRLYKQKYQWCGFCFKIEQIYGINLNQINQAQMEQCIICMSNKADTLILPCRHMCICEDCGKLFMDKKYEACPVCRKGFSSLIVYAQK